MLMILLVILYIHLNTLDYYFYQINGGVPLSCFIGGSYSYTAKPPYI